jgi:DNA-binding transcriptional LysR family regulator
MMLNLHQMHAFCVVAEHRSFRVAAGKLGISDRAISQEIIQLEKSLGKKLINRDTRFRGLTPFGKRYLSETEPHLIKIQAAVEMFREMWSQPSELVPAESPDAGDVANQPL